jgi:hypothetical protein
LNVRKGKLTGRRTNCMRRKFVFITLIRVYKAVENKKGEHGKKEYTHPH